MKISIKKLHKKATLPLGYEVQVCGAGWFESIGI